MVTNTAGTATDLPASKENGECKKDEDSSEKSLKSSLNDSVKTINSESHQNNDSTTTMSASLQEKFNEEPKFNQTSNVEGMASSANNYNNRSFSNGLPSQSVANQQSSSSYHNYIPPNHNSQVLSGNSGAPRPPQSGQTFQSSMHPRYPLHQQGVSTPTLNQLLTAPSRHPTPFPAYANQSMEYGQNSYQQNWSSQTTHDRAAMDQSKADYGNYPPPQQYPVTQHSNFPPHYNRYPAPPGNQPQYGQPQQFNPSGNTQQPGFPSTVTNQPRHPGYSGYSNFNNTQQASYYSQRPMHSQAGAFPPSTNNHNQLPPDSLPPHIQQQTQKQQPEQSSFPSGSDKIYQQPKESMMSPARGTSQPGLNSGSTPSPMNANPHAHTGHPSLSHFRGPSSTPGSPSVASQHRSTPLSPSVRSDGSQPPHPMRPASGHSEHSNPPVPSPLSAGNYGGYRSHSSQQPYGWQPHNYPHHMMSPQHQPSYSSGPTPGLPHIRPPSVGKTVHPSSQPSTQPPPSSAYPQSGGQLPYYDNMPPVPASMPGYTSASPAPERRPSRQGSHPPVVLTPEPNSRQGAAAAAAAAMAAAAHSAQPGTTSTTKALTPSYYPQQRMQHPNMPQQGIDINQQGFPRMANSALPASGAPQRPMVPPGMGPNANPGNYRMPPPSHPSQFPTSYSQPAGPYQQGGYPGYNYPPDPNQLRGPRPGYRSSPGFQQQPPLTQEEPVKKTKTKASTRSTTQKLAALFEPADEPGRREFIDDVLRYWDEKEVPLKNAPLMGRKTLDLFRLYHVVKEKGGMVEVTGAKKWPEISTMLGLGTTSTSGFTLKKQYCKYLYGYECKIGRGIPEPQEALTRVTEAHRKRKQLQDNNKDEMRPASQAPPGMLSSHPQAHPPQTYPTSQYPPPPGQQYQMQPPPVHSGPGYMMPQNSSSLPHPGYPQHPGPVGLVGPPSNTYPGPSQGPGAPQSWSQSIPPRKPLQVPGGPEPVASQRKNDMPQPLEPGQKLQQTYDSSAPPRIDSNPPLKPPAPTNGPVAAGNPFGELSSGVRPLQPGLHPNQAPHMETTPSYSRSLQDSLRPPSRPAMLSSPYPYSNSPMSRPLRAPSTPAETHSTPTPIPRPSYQPTPPAHPGPINNSYPGHLGLKRPSTDSFGPPQKYARSNTSHVYPPNQPSFRPDMLRHRYPSSESLPGGGYRPPVRSLNGGLRSSQSRMHSPYELQRFPSYPINRSNRGAHYSRGSMKMRQTRSPLSMNTMLKYPPDQRPNLNKHLQAHKSHIKREVSLFPPGSVEATSLKLSKFRPKTCQSVGLIESWPLIMSLKSGLLVESSWALNVLTVLLFDQRSVGQFRLSQLPGLLDAVVEHFRRCLSEIFFLPSERDALGVPDCSVTKYDNSDDEVTESDEQCYVNRAKQFRKNRKLTKFMGKHDTHKIKIEPRPDTFLFDYTDQWDDCGKVNLSDDLNHIILTVSKSMLNRSDLTNSKQDSDPGSIPCIEATLEDVLSIPYAVLAPDDYTKPTFNLKDEMKSIKNKDKAESNDDCLNVVKNDEERDLSQGDVSDATNAAVQSTDNNVECKNANNGVKESKSAHVCNGLLLDFAEKLQNSDEANHATADTSSSKPDDDFQSASSKDEKSYANGLSLVIKVKKLMEERNVVLLEDEVAGSNGRRDPFSGPVFSSKFSHERIELANRLIAISNVIRGFSFIPSNVNDIMKHHSLMRALSAILLIRHKHKLKRRKDLSEISPKAEEFNKIAEASVVSEVEVKSSKLRRSCESPTVQSNCIGAKQRKSRVTRSKSSEHLVSSEDQKEKTEEKQPTATLKNYLFSSTVLHDEKEAKSVYNDPWWWNCVRRLREDALVIIANMSPSLDLSVFPDDETPLGILEACFHWIVCPSSDACDAFSDKPREYLSPCRLSLEILSKLSIKEQNVDLILAIRPYRKLEKLFMFLISAIGDRKDPVYREFSIVLLSNLSQGDPNACRSIALQSGSISNLIAFLEECEERGHNHRQVFRQNEVNYGTTVFMMLKVATTLHSLAVIPENKPLFVKHQLRLLSLSMSYILSNRITSVISSLLFELSCETT